MSVKATIAITVSVLILSSAAMAGSDATIRFNRDIRPITIYSQGGVTHDNYGRDHHPRCYTMWMAGGGSRPGLIHGETDDFSYNIVKDPVNVHDFHATVLRLMGNDHETFTYRYQGLDQRLSGVELASIVPELMV